MPQDVGRQCDDGGLYRHRVPPGKGSIDGVGNCRCARGMILGDCHRGVRSVESQNPQTPKSPNPQTPKPQNPKTRDTSAESRFWIGMGPGLAAASRRRCLEHMKGVKKSAGQKGVGWRVFSPAGKPGTSEASRAYHEPRFRGAICQFGARRKRGYFGTGTEVPTTPRSNPHGGGPRTPRFSAKPPLLPLSTDPAPRPSTDRPRRTAHPPRAPSACYTTSNYSTSADGTPAAPPAATPILQRGPCATSMRSTYQRPTTTRGA